MRERKAETRRLRLLIGVHSCLHIIHRQPHLLYKGIKLSRSHLGFPYQIIDLLQAPTHHQSTPTHTQKKNTRKTLSPFTSMNTLSPMKINIVPRLFWSPLVALLAMVGIAFTILASAVPVPVRHVGPIAISRTTLSPIPIKVHPPAVIPVIYKRDLPTAIAPKEPESESVNNVELSKRRAIVYGKLEFVGHPKYETRDLFPLPRLTIWSPNANPLRAVSGSPSAVRLVLVSLFYRKIEIDTYAFPF